MAKHKSVFERVTLGLSVGVIFGAVAAALVAATPPWMFDDAVGPYALPGGAAGRLLAAGLAFVGVTLLVWGLIEAASRAVILYRSIATEVEEELDLAAHPAIDVERPRKPIFADRELGAPFMSDEALATAAPLILSDPVAEDPVLAAPLDIEEFDLPAVDEASEPLPGETSIEALIRRLEAGLAKRETSPPPEPTPPAAPLPTRDWLARDDDDADQPRAMRTLRAMASR